MRASQFVESAPFLLKDQAIRIEQRDKAAIERHRLVSDVLPRESGNRSGFDSDQGANVRDNEPIGALGVVEDDHGRKERERLIRQVEEPGEMKDRNGLRGQGHESRKETCSDRRGRQLWQEMNVPYAGSVQRARLVCNVENKEVLDGRLFRACD